METTLHITKQGHKCINPLNTPPASYVKAGETLSLGEWELSYSTRQRAYMVHRNQYPWGQFPNYQFNNFNCAAAKLAELGGKK